MKNDEIEKALKKFETISPLINDSLSLGEKRQVRKSILHTTGWSERTLRRYLASYRRGRIDGLKPKARSDKGVMRKISLEVLDAASALRLDTPELSVERITEILISDGVIQQGAVARSTLSRHLRRIGASAKEIKANKQPAGRRFVRVGRNTLWQSDVKYGPFISAGSKKERTYLVTMIDDATRYVCHSEFYDTQKLLALEDCLRKAILKCGVPDNLYVDNGKIYRSKSLLLACARLGIRHMNAKPYQPASKGKIERYNRTVEEFLRELKLQPAKSVRELNIQYRIWLDEGYNRRTHGSLNKSPDEAFKTDAKKIRLSSFSAIKDAFLLEETRKTDKSGCITINGVLFEAGLEYCGKRVEVRFDPFDLSEVELYYGGELKKTIHPANIGEFCKRKNPEEKSSIAKHSRLLSTLAKKRIERLRKQGLINFEGNNND